MKLGWTLGSVHGNKDTIEFGDFKIYLGAIYPWFTPLTTSETHETLLKALVARNSNQRSI